MKVTLHMVYIIKTNSETFVWGKIKETEKLKMSSIYLMRDIPIISFPFNKVHT